MGALNSLASLGLNLALNQRAQAAEDKQLKQERDRQLKAIDLRDTEDRRQQELSLRRRLADAIRACAARTSGTASTVGASAACSTSPGAPCRSATGSWALPDRGGACSIERRGR